MSRWEVNRTNSRFTHSCILCRALNVHRILPSIQSHYITPDGSLAPLLICNMFIGPAGIRTRACRQAFDLFPPPGLLRKVKVLKLVWSGCMKIDRNQVWWRKRLWSDLCQCIHALNLSFWGWAMTLGISFSGGPPSIHAPVWSSTRVVSLCRPSLLRNVNGCQLQTAFHILTPSNLLQRQRCPSTASLPYAAAWKVPAQMLLGVITSWAVCPRRALQTWHLCDAFSCVDRCLD